MARSNAERQRAYRERHPEYRERNLSITRERKKRLRLEILTHYGGGKPVCVRCGFDDIRALSIDHINGRPANFATQIRKGVKTEAAISLKKQGFPPGYQTLCMNCQWIKRNTKGEFLSPGKREAANSVVGEFHWWE